MFNIKLNAMKKLLLYVLILGMGLPVFSQKRYEIPKEKAIVVRTGVTDNNLDKAEFINKTVNSTEANPIKTNNDFTIGTTKYDLQSNGALANRIWLFDDGTAAAVWTMGFEEDNFLDRGTGYNYFDGYGWGPAPAQRIEDVRTGWPSIAAWGENGEIIVSHNIFPPTWTEDGLVINKRANKGSGDWIQSMLPGPSNMGGIGVKWPRIMTSGENHYFIHIIVPADNACQGQDLPLLYNRSNDGGETWIGWLIIEEINSDYYKGFRTDEYTWAESKGDVIAFTISSPWHDWIIMKSTDNGENWEKMVIWEHPYPMFDWQTTITTDTIWAPDYSVDIAIDDDGIVHTVCGLTRVIHTQPGISYSFFPWTDGIVYWNETMPPFIAENQHRALAYENLVDNETLIGWVVDNGTPLMEDVFSYRELGMSTMPNITADNGKVIVVWSSITAGFDNGQYNFRHIWSRLSCDNGNPGTWGYMIDLDTDVSHWLDECIYPVMAGRLDNAENYNVIYNIDATPGLAVLDDHDYQTNRTVFCNSGSIIWQEPHIFVYPTNFIIVKPGENIYEFKIFNTGNATLTLNSIVNTKTWISDDTYPQTPTYISPGDSLTVSFYIDWDQIISGADTGYIWINSNDISNPLVKIDITAITNGAFPYLEVSEIDLGTQGPVYPFDTVFTIMNTGADTLTGSVSENLPWITSLYPDSFTLATFQEQEFSISGLFPDVAGDFSGIIEITSNGGDIELPVFGTVGIQSVLFVSPVNIDLGTDSAGSSFTQSFTVKNNGTGQLTGNIYENANWILSMQPANLSLDIGEEIIVSFYGQFPPETGPFSTIINVVTNGGDQGIFVSGVTGDVSVPETFSTDNAIVLYPNPSSGKVHFKTSLSDIEPLKVNVYSSFGKRLYSGNKKVTNDIINLSEYGKGIYFVEFETGDRVFVRRVCIID